MLAGILSFWTHLGSQLKQWTKPATVTLVRGTIADLTRSQTDLVVKNAILRQQLIVLNRQVKRPQLTNSDRIRLVFLARCTGYWQQALHTQETIKLIKQMATENRLWGAEGIRGELLKLARHHSQQAHCPEVHDPGQRRFL